MSKWQKQRRRHKEQFSGSHGRRGHQDKKDKQITRTRDRQDRQIWHLNLTIQVSCVGQLSQFLRRFYFWLEANKAEMQSISFIDFDFVVGRLFWKQTDKAKTTFQRLHEVWVNHETRSRIPYYFCHWVPMEGEESPEQMRWVKLHSAKSCFIFDAQYLFALPMKFCVDQTLFWGKSEWSGFGAYKTPNGVNVA